MGQSKNLRGAHGRAPCVAAVRKRDVFVGGCLSFGRTRTGEREVFLWTSKEKVVHIYKLESTSRVAQRHINCISRRTARSTGSGRLCRATIRRTFCPRIRHACKVRQPPKVPRPPICRQARFRTREHINCISRRTARSTGSGRLYRATIRRALCPRVRHAC